MDISLEKASNYRHIYQKHDLTLFTKLFKWYNNKNSKFLHILFYYILIKVENKRYKVTK